MSSIPSQDIGIVKAVNGSRYTVEIAKGGGCKSCAMHGICGIDKAPMVLNLDSPQSFVVGDRVELEIAAGTRVLSALLIFVLPILILVLGFSLTRTFLSEPFAILAGFGSMAIAFLFIRFIDKRVSKKINFQIKGKYEDLPE